MRASRLLSILIFLQLRGRLTAEVLAQEFDVSVRTIYRDIDALGAAGIPLYCDRGPGGGFQLVDGYRTRLTGLATDEAEAMFMIGMPGPAKELGLGSAATMAGRKFQAMLSPNLSEIAGRLGGRFHLDPVDWYRTAEPLDHLPAIARAVFDQRVVTMTYESWTQTRESRVEPLGLVLKAGSWYLVARAARKIRNYKVSNIRNHAIGEQRFERPADFDLPTWWASEMRQFESRLRPSHASLRVSATGLKRLSELGAYAAEAIARADGPDAQGHVRLSLPIESVEHAALLLLGIGPEFEILAPVALRERIRELARQTARRMR